jgi:drug/metabolite transporter (DMT)-like permease
MTMTPGRRCAYGYALILSAGIAFVVLSRFDGPQPSRYDGLTGLALPTCFLIGSIMCMSGYTLGARRRANTRTDKVAWNLLFLTGSVAHALIAYVLFALVLTFSFFLLAGIGGT